MPCQGSGSASQRALTGKRCFLPGYLWQEDLPDGILRMVDADVNQRMMAGFGWLCFQLHASLLWGASSLAGIAVNAGTDDVVPLSFSSQTSGYDVIHTHLAHGQILPTVLASLFVSGKQVAAAESQGLPGNLLELGQSNHTWDLDWVRDGLNPLEIEIKIEVEIVDFFAQDTQFLPGVEIVVGKLPIFLVNNLCTVSVEQQECTAYRHQVHCHKETVQDQNM